MTTVLRAITDYRWPIADVLIRDERHRSILPSRFTSCATAHIVGDQKVADVVLGHLRVLVAGVARLLIALLTWTVVSRPKVLWL